MTPQLNRKKAAVWLASLVIAPALLANCSSSSPTGDATAGSSNAGSDSAGSNSAGSSNVGGAGAASNATCVDSDCGPALGLANYQCPDRSVAGPTGRCLKEGNSSCSWEIRSCPPSSAGGGGGGEGVGTGAGAGSGGQASVGGGQTQWPDWVGQCLAIRAERCDGCFSQACLVCVYGTDQEIASTGVSCDEPLRNYKEACNCHTSGCPLYCRPEYQ